VWEEVRHVRKGPKITGLVAVPAKMTAERRKHACTYAQRAHTHAPMRAFLNKGAAHVQSKVHVMVLYLWADPQQPSLLDALQWHKCVYLCLYVCVCACSPARHGLYAARIARGPCAWQASTHTGARVYAPAGHGPHAGYNLQ